MTVRPIASSVDTPPMKAHGGARKNAGIDRANAGNTASEAKPADRKEEAPPSFHSMLRESHTEHDDSRDDADDAKPESDDDVKRVAVVEIPTTVREVLPFTFVMPRMIEPKAQHKAESANTTPTSLLTVDVPQPTAADEAEIEEPEAGKRTQPALESVAAAPQVDAEVVTSQKGEIAFAAKLTPQASDPAPQIQGTNKAVAPQKTINTNPADAIIEHTAKPVPQEHAQPQAPVHAAFSAAPPAKIDIAPQVNAVSASARLEDVMDLRPGPATNASDIIVRIADTDRAADVRFVERGGEVHVSVRTSDDSMAQTLRSGLTDLAARMEQGGIKTEMWRPGSENQDQNQADRRSSDQRNAHREKTASDQEDLNRDSKKPKWVEALELSIGRQN